MYPYHNKIKQRIKNGELVKYEFVEKYKNISPCLLLYFNTEPYIRPVREHRFAEYEEILSLQNKISKQKEQ
ncbi:hypothetical protein [Capnocytophaga cynodegmi]|nr:hypothetical protein [Capnocytophaga cynodegmi]GJQ06473.1 hypothetical protein CAPN010_06310 [Capnocytophaga cynodegmi]